jgi:hypothetical protein
VDPRAWWRPCESREETLEKKNNLRILKKNLAIATAF